MREGLDADDAAGQADQDKGEGGASRTVCDVPTGRSGGGVEDLCGGVGADTTLRCDLTEASIDVTALNPSSTQQTLGSLGCLSGLTAVETVFVRHHVSIHRRKSPDGPAPSGK